MFEAPCDIIARLLFFDLQTEFDKRVLNFMEFATRLINLHEDNREIRNRMIFKIYDIDRDGNIDIINLIQIFRQLPKKSLIRYEFLLLLLEYKNKNVLKPIFQGRQEITFSIFNKLIP